jgi:hypothetical protein
VNRLIAGHAVDVDGRAAGHVLADLHPPLGVQVLLDLDVVLPGLAMRHVRQGEVPQLGIALCGSQLGSNAPPLGTQPAPFLRMCSHPMSEPRQPEDIGRRPAISPTIPFDARTTRGAEAFIFCLQTDETRGGARASIWGADTPVGSVGATGFRR